MTNFLSQKQREMVLKNINIISNLVAT